MKNCSCYWSLLLVLAAAPVALAAPGQRGPAPRGAGPGAAECAGSGPNAANCLGNGPGAATCGSVGACAVAATDPTPLTLSAGAQAALLFQIDEERMAGELYRAWGAKWDLVPFAHIPLAEARHETVLRQLATRAGLALPAAVPGHFASAEVQKRHDDLLPLGLVSADGALRAAAYVEEVDIADLRTLLASTDNAAWQEIAAMLETASGHHLGAFVGLLAARGVTYVPQLLPAADYQAILDRRGALGRGRGWGRGRG